jgi:DNA-binding transcriptional MerR regulator
MPQPHEPQQHQAGDAHAPAHGQEQAHGQADGSAQPATEEEVGYRGVAAMRAAGISYRQLDYWARTGLVTPSIRDASGSGTQRLYSFRDLVVLKVVKSLLDAGVSLQNIRKAVDTLRAHGVEDLARLTLISDGTTVYECRSAEEVVDLLQGGQGVFGIAIGGACREIEGTLTHLPSADQGTPTTAQADNYAAEQAELADELAARRARRRTG